MEPTQFVAGNWQDAMFGNNYIYIYHAFSSISNVHWEDLAHCGWLQALFDQWKLSDVIGTGEKFHHIVSLELCRLFPRPHHILFGSSMHLKEQFPLRTPPQG